MSSTNGFVDIIGTIARVAETDRQLREIGGLVERSLDTLKKAWPLVAMAGIGWLYMVSDDQRVEVLDGLLNGIEDVLPLDDIGKLVGVGVG
jgi:hypothetical protein